ncbi:MAG: amino acid--tRNA ligase-related protein, partial [Planctomycetota bacterium]
MAIDTNDVQPPSDTGDRADIHHLEAQRRLNRDAVRDTGLDPYGSRADGLLTLAEAHAQYDADADAEHQSSDAERRAAKKADPAAGEDTLPALVDARSVVRVAGRVVLLRDNGKLVWLNIRDSTRVSFQIAVSKRDADEGGFSLAKAADLGDIVIAEGPLMKTKLGEVTCWAKSLRPASKCLLPPPEKHAGLSDVEARYRRRYVDLWSNPETARVFEIRSAIVARIRAHLTELGFMEVETPMLQTQAGGAAARPFLTHMNALDIELSMRIAPELFLKRLLVGGFHRVFEINRNFRNEGLDKQHNPEFTMLELYQAFGDYHTVMDVTEGVVR